LYPDLITPKAVENLSFVYNKNHFRKFIASNEYLSKKSDPTLNEIMYECEKILQKESKTGVTLNMNDIMADAISGIVYYIKFELDDHGIGEWKWMDETNIRTFGRVYLRTKNGYTRASDRMGIQV
jgi:CRISPR/Cas system CMR-associated protein Cmr3 (group 5 of RAMP superfamily)